MGFATSVTVAIFFMGFTIIATMVYPVIVHSYSDIQESIKERHTVQMEELNTHIDVVSSVSGSGIIDITISNRGSTVLHANRSNVLLDGTYSTYSVSPSGLWLPGRNAVFTLNTDTSINHTVKIITENGISTYKEV